MRRREFIALAGGAAAWPYLAQAQPSKAPRVGVLITSGPEAFLSEFRKGLGAFGYIEGQTIQLEIRSVDGQLHLLPGLADELVRLKVDIIVASQTPAVFAARAATTEIPIVMAPAGDPLGTGLIASLARPGGNITGTSSTGPEHGAKLAEYIRGMLPSARRVAFLAHANNPFTKPFGALIEQGGHTMGFALQTIAVRGADEFPAAFAAMAKERAEAVIVQPSLPGKVASAQALQYRLPSFSIIKPFAREGGLLAYSSVQDFDRAGYYIDRILKGAKPGNLAVEQPSRYETVVNLKTARALGLSVPPLVLAQADEVIE